MSFEFRPAVRENTSLIIGIAGASGGGKTKSALRLARGLAGPNGRIGGIDTEAGRMLHYADEHVFDHGDMGPPFSPEAYSAAIRAADEAHYDVIIVDSCSHEWEGEGGLHGMHDAEVAEAVEKAKKYHRESWGPFDAEKAAEKASIGAWKEPKAKHKRFVNQLLQCRAHLILCFRAEEKLRMEQVVDPQTGKKKTVIVQPKDMPPNERWVPICEKRLMFEMTISFIVTPQQPGVPIPIKIQEQHRFAFEDGQPVSEKTGELLAQWARGKKEAPLKMIRGNGTAQTFLSVKAWSDRILGLLPQLNAEQVAQFRTVNGALLAEYHSREDAAEAVMAVSLAITARENELKGAEA